MADLPPMEPDTDEASSPQLDAARRQGEAYGAALRMMTDEIAQVGGSTRSGHYLVGFAVEEAEGLYTLRGGDLQWNEPEEENAHIEVVVCDAADGRFVPGLDVTVTVVDGDGAEVGTHPHRLVWHPMLYHYARNWTLPGDGTYTLVVEFPPPKFMRHDRVNGRRFVEPCRVEFTGVEIETGRE